MRARLRQALTVLIATGALVVSLGVATPAPAHAQLFTNSVKEACGGASLRDDDVCVDGANRVNSIIEVALNLLSVVAGIGAVVMLIIAGIRYTTSGGDSSGISGAKNTIIYAIIGIVIVALAQLIVQFVIKRLGDQL